MLPTGLLTAAIPYWCKSSVHLCISAAWHQRCIPCPSPLPSYSSQHPDWLAGFAPGSAIYFMVAHCNYHHCFLLIFPFYLLQLGTFEKYKCAQLNLGICKQSSTNIGVRDTNNRMDLALWMHSLHVSTQNNDFVISFISFTHNRCL